MPDVSLDPELVLLIFLPPLLYAAAFFANLRELRNNLRPITGLAVGQHPTLHGPIDCDLPQALERAIDGRDSLRATGIPRGYNYFGENPEAMLEWFDSHMRQPHEVGVVA